MSGARRGRPGLTTGGVAAIVALAGIVAANGLSDDTNPIDDGEVFAKSDRTVRYGRDIRPILSDRCFVCHGPDKATQMADLRLDLRTQATAARPDGGRPAIVPGDPDASELIARITSHDPVIAMPPAAANKRPLSETEIGLIRQWIAEGAAYESHWAFEAPERPAVPTPRAVDRVRTPVDAFILAELDRIDVHPSPPTDRATWCRRVFLDLTGLPPTPAEVETFLADDSPEASGRLVDRLLTEEPYRQRYAERMATPWLDQARYADTIGIHTDNGQQMWLWRDWVLAAYRDNMPFDQFIHEQLAGDLMESPTTDQLIATGFNRAHILTDEGGAISEEYLIEYAADRAETTASVMLGLTIGCSRCHDHKFDPISMEDYYSFLAFFNSVEQPGLYSQTPAVQQRAFEPFLVVPTDEQHEMLETKRTLLAELETELEERTPDELERRDAFVSELAQDGAIAWAPVNLVAAEATSGTTLTIDEERGVAVASGTNPGTEVYELTLDTDATELRAVSLEALNVPWEGRESGRPGRSAHGNVVITEIEVEAAPMDDPEAFEPVDLMWAWADHSQGNNNFDVTNVLDPSKARGWAFDSHLVGEVRTGLFLAEAPFGFESGTRVRVRLKQESVYQQHNMAEVRVRAGMLGDDALARLPVAPSRWHVAGPYPDRPGDTVYDPSWPPERLATIDLDAEIPGTDAGDDAVAPMKWRFNNAHKDEVVANFAAKRGVHYIGRTVYAPTAREVEISLGSDDGFAVFVNGEEVVEKRVPRGAAPDQDRVTIPLRQGPNAVVMKVVNTGGPTGFYWRFVEDESELRGDLAAAVLADHARAGIGDSFEVAWRTKFLPRYKETRARMLATRDEIKAIEDAQPRTMIMKERDEPRPTYVLNRGVYDDPDESRPVSRRTPAALGGWSDEARADRLGLAQWLTSAENPLFARVMVNRVWAQFFGTGIVETSGDFGFQGSWPSHPELLDWLAVDFRESGWDLHHLVKQIVLSDAYRRSSKVRPELAEIDPGNRRLAYFPRRRLPAETIRDQALFASGLLVEDFGGAPVKPYQPEGLWREVAMVQSNTRNFQRDEGEALWRRSVYTYWKRACPPPSMMAFDAPTREFCTIRRQVTNTPLQALVLWNDEQFVEASRALAARVLRGDATDDDARLTALFVRCTAREPRADELPLLREALAAFRARYADAPEDAAALISVGVSTPPEELDPAELAAWTMLANAALNLYETTTQR